MAPARPPPAPFTLVPERALFDQRNTPPPTPRLTVTPGKIDTSIVGEFDWVGISPSSACVTTEPEADEVMSINGVVVSTVTDWLTVPTCICVSTYFLSPTCNSMEVRSSVLNPGAFT